MVYVGTTNALVGYGLIVPPTTVPVAPTGLAAQTVSASQVQLTWTDTARDEAGFEVDQSTDGVNFYPVATPPVNSQSWLIGGLLPDTTYTFRVEATNALGSSLPSNIASATTSALANGVDYSTGFATAGASVALNGSATIVGGALQLTDTTNTGEAGSAFAANPVDVGGFSTTFQFPAHQTPRPTGWPSSSRGKGRPPWARPAAGSATRGSRRASPSSSTSTTTPARGPTPPACSPTGPTPASPARST